MKHSWRCQGKTKKWIVSCQSSINVSSGCSQLLDGMMIELTIWHSLGNSWFPTVRLFWRKNNRCFLGVCIFKGCWIPWYIQCVYIINHNNNSNNTNYIYVDIVYIYIRYCIYIYTRYCIYIYSVSYIITIMYSYVSEDFYTCYCLNLRWQARFWASPASQA